MMRLPDPARSRAVLIGTSSYADPALPSLPAVRHNLSDLHTVLTSEQGCGLPDTDAARHCVVLHDPSDAAEVGDCLERAAHEAEDLLLVYYAGHGQTWTSRDELYLALRNTRVNTVGTSALRCADVRQMFLDSGARVRVLIVDCCFSGRAFERTMAGSASALLAQVDVHGAYTLAATQPNQLARAPDGHRNTLFTGELLRLLRHGIPEGPELLTLDVLYRELKASLRRRNLPEPSCKNSDAAAHLALARNAAYHSVGEIPLLQRRIAELEALRRAYPDRKAGLRAAIDELAAVETETARSYRAVRDKIADPRLPPLTTHAPELDGQLSGLDQLARDGKWTELTDRLDRLERETAEALEGARSRQAAATSLIERRRDLRGQLEILQAMAVRLGLAERDVIAAHYAQAHDCLWTKPCDLRIATQAVLAFQKSLTDGREGRTDG